MYYFLEVTVGWSRRAAALDAELFSTPRRRRVVHTVLFCKVSFGGKEQMKEVRTAIADFRFGKGTWRNTKMSELSLAKILRAACVSLRGHTTHTETHIDTFSVRVWGLFSSSSVVAVWKTCCVRSKFLLSFKAFRVGSFLHIFGIFGLVGWSINIFSYLFDEYSDFCTGRMRERPQ